MRRATSILLLVAFVGLAAPALAEAGPLDAFRKATLQSATGTVEITQTRCAPGSSDCGKVQLEETFRSGRKPKLGTSGGLPGFATGRRISGQGTGACSAESATTIVTGVDGSMQILTGAERLDPGRFAATRIAVAGGKRGVRVLWREPLTPSIACDYFNEPGTTVALPAGASPPTTLASPTIGLCVLRRPGFTITISGSKNWTGLGADGTRVASRATWKLKLVYKN